MGKSSRSPVPRLSSSPRARSRAVPARLPADVQGDLDVLPGRKGGDEVEVLEDEAHRARPEGRQLTLAERGDVRAVHPDLARADAQEPAQHREKGRLPAARGPHYEHDLAAGEVEVEAAHGLDASLALTERLGEVVDPDEH